jgi:hypothetical protein
MPPPSAALSSSLSSRKRGNNLCAPRIFLFVIVIIAFGLLAVSIYLTSRLDSSWLPNTDVIATTFGNDETIRPVICNELLKDSSILDPSKSRAALILYFALGVHHISKQFLFLHKLFNAKTKAK